MSHGGPKSAYELAMEKLARKDAEAGVEATTLTAAQREAIGRRDYDAKALSVPARRRRRAPRRRSAHRRLG